VFSALEAFYENALYKFTFDIDIDIDNTEAVASPDKSAASVGEEEAQQRMPCKRQTTIRVTTTALLRVFSDN